MGKPLTNFSFIDGQNLHLSIEGLGWSLDYRRFRRYLAEKYGVAKAFLFIGYVRKHARLYAFLEDSGYVCVFRPTLMWSDGTLKGNCDAELVLHAMIEIGNYDKAVIISGDGDFHCLVRYLITLGKLEKMLVPNKGKYSSLLKHLPSQYLAFVSDLEVALKRKEPRKDGTLKGAFRRDS